MEVVVIKKRGVDVDADKISVAGVTSELLIAATLGTRVTTTSV